MFGLFGLKAKLIIAGAILLIIVGLSATAYIYYLKAKNAEQQLSIAVRVNEENTRIAKEIREDWALEKVETEKELAATQKRATAIEKVKQEIQNAPEANDPAGPFWDDLGERLRSLNSGTTN